MFGFVLRPYFRIIRERCISDGVLRFIFVETAMQVFNRGFNHVQRIEIRGLFRIYNAHNVGVGKHVDAFGYS